MFYTNDVSFYLVLRYSLAKYKVIQKTFFTPTLGDVLLICLFYLSVKLVMSAVGLDIVKSSTCRLYLIILLILIRK